MAVGKRLLSGSCLTAMAISRTARQDEDLPEDWVKREQKYKDSNLFFKAAKVRFQAIVPTQGVQGVSHLTFRPIIYGLSLEFCIYP